MLWLGEKGCEGEAGCVSQDFGHHRCRGWHLPPFGIHNPKSLPEIKNLTQPLRTSVCVYMCMNVYTKTDETALPSLPNRPFLVLGACWHVAGCSDKHPPRTGCTYVPWWKCWLPAPSPRALSASSAPWLLDHIHPESWERCGISGFRRVRWLLVGEWQFQMKWPK